MHYRIYSEGKQMKQIWILWGEDPEGKFIAGVYADKVKAEADMRMALSQPDPGAHYHIQEKEITA
jgi:hypothetical protein